MTLRAVYCLLGVIATFSSAVMVLAAAHADKSMSLGAALFFAASVILAGAWVNAVALPRDARAGLGALAKASQFNALILALVFGWGALSLLGVYSLSGLWWWHSWQYGGVMFAVAVLLAFFARAVGRPGHMLAGDRLLDASAVLALLQGLGAGVGLAFLISTGKLSSLKSDWPANHLFLGGGIAICLLSLMAAVTHYRLRSRA